MPRSLRRAPARRARRRGPDLHPPNANGVVEATNVPDARDFRLTYPGKGTLIHSRGFRLRPSYNGEFDQHIDGRRRHHGVERRAGARGHPGRVGVRPPGRLLEGRAGADAAHARHRAALRRRRTPSIRARTSSAACSTCACCSTCSGATSTLAAGRLQRGRERGAALQRHAALQGDARLRAEDPARCSAASPRRWPRARSPTPRRRAPAPGHRADAAARERAPAAPARAPRVAAQAARRRGRASTTGGRTRGGVAPRRPDPARRRASSTPMIRALD